MQKFARHYYLETNKIKQFFFAHLLAKNLCIIISIVPVGNNKLHKQKSIFNSGIVETYPLIINFYNSVCTNACTSICVQG